jgi:hypothetical protein
MVNKLALFITHNIFLTNNQINELIENNTLECFGVSVPVWISAKNAKTTEPASEVFCSYQIVNDKNFEQDIEITKKGYKIFFPNANWKPPKPMIDMSEMTQEERAYHERKRDRWWQKNSEPMNIKTFKKSKYFRMQIKKLDQKIDKINADIDIQHTLEIKTLDCLVSSIS